MLKHDVTQILLFTMTSQFVIDVDGIWQHAPLSLFGGDLYKFERDLLTQVPLVKDELQGLGCFGEYIQGASINLLNTDQVILEVFCGQHTAWVFMDGMPPKSVETYFQNPMMSM